MEEECDGSTQPSPSLSQAETQAFSQDSEILEFEQTHSCAVCHSCNDSLLLRQRYLETNSSLLLIHNIA